MLRRGSQSRVALLISFSYIVVSGIVDYCRRYADGAYKVCQTMTPPPVQYDIPTAEQVQESFQKSIPLDKVADRRQWRDDRLAALATMKRQCDSADQSQK